MNARNHPNTGRFAPGNPGREKGSKNLRTRQWEELGQQITEANAGRFNELLGRLWDSRELSEQIRAAELFLKFAEFFKPKLQRIQTPDIGRTPLIPPNIVIRHITIGADGAIVSEREHERPPFKEP